MSKIKLISHDEPLELWRSRADFAKITNQPLIERPYWYQNIETDQCYYDLFACLGWPSEVTDSSDGLPGYIAVLGVVKDPESTGSGSPLTASFQLLAEDESKDVPILMQKCIAMRDEWGFGVHKSLLNVWFGDPDRFLTTLALVNEDLVIGGEDKAIVIFPPDDLYTKKIFDAYVRALKSTLLRETRRLYFGKNDILQNRLREFNRDDPCVMAVGGLVYSLLCRVRWMDYVEDTLFTVDG